jgi:hypothetical protein
MKTPIFTFCLLLGLSMSSAAQSEQDLVLVAERQESQLNESGAFETLLQVSKINPSNYLALWKLSELCSRLGKRQPKKEQQQEFYKLGKSYALRAVQVNPSGADGYYVLAVAMGRMALTQSGKEKIKSVKEIRSYTEKALSLNPSHGRAWHVLGKWHYEVSNLGFFEKAGLKIIYGGLPPASFKESIRCYEKARVLEPDFALNFLELAKAYHKNDQDDKAFECLRKLPSVPLKTADDAHIKQEGAKLLKDWSQE